ncbi:MAG: hypothetical protein M1348_00125 [Candidatus Parvarchaeota archaeon]|jgi:amino acid permease|nr:hypothetical protein [Candidatus Parvarchaeota archaeon]MCL5101005.1 hypothetical protein [Candidatus Parvarchaeota archaeon]
MDSHYLAAVGTVVGTVIGAGILALPYAISQAGFLIGAGLIFLIGVSSILITMYTGELSFRLKKIHQLPALISDYAGHRFRAMTLVLQVLIIDGAILAYLIAMGISMNLLLGLPYILSILIVFLLAAPVIYKGYIAVERAETALSMVKLALIVAVSLLVVFPLHIGNLFTMKVNNSLQPFGVILFALMAYTVVPEVREELHNNPKHFNRVIIISMLISMAVYLLFAAAFMGAFGSNVSIIATNSLASGQYSIIFYLLTIFLVITPYISLSLVVVDAFNYDFKLRRGYSFWLSVLIPLGLAIIGFNFERVLEAIGGVLLPVLSLLILYAVYQERRRFGNSRRYRAPGGLAAILFTSAVMVIGFIYTLLYVVI